MEVVSSAVATPEWPTQASAYSFMGKIGQGAFATVWKAQYNTTTTTTTDHAAEHGATNIVAIKILNLDHVDTNLSEIRLEVQAMRLSSHPNLLTCHAAFCHETQLWLVTPLMNKGSSLHCLQAARRALKRQQQASTTLLSFEQHIMYILYETLLGLQYIHDENGQIHRDIKAGNILLDGTNGNVKIADFGVSGWLVQGGAQQQKAKTFVGTPCWMAPEVMEQVHGYDYKADIWSLGITALELAKGYAPYAKYPPMKVLILTIQQDPPSLASYEDTDDEIDDTDAQYSQQFNEIVNWCLQKSPAHRPTCLQLLQSKYFAQYNSSNAPGGGNNSSNNNAFHEQARQNLQALCSLVPDVGSTGTNNSASASATNAAMPGNSPVSIILQTDNVDRPPGTTWVFADGSQILSSSATQEDTMDQVMAELDEFGKETGGEHYSGRSAADTVLAGNKNDSDVVSNNSDDEYQQQYQEAINNSKNKPEGDDLDAFMDEFEQNTAGENFRR